MEGEQPAFQAKVDRIAREAEERLRTASYQLLVSSSKDTQRLSDWALITTGAVLTLLVPRLRDLLEIVALLDLQVALGMILVSGFVGLLAKHFHHQIEERCSGDTAGAVAVADALKIYFEKFDRVREEAKKGGHTVTTSLDLGEAVEPIRRFSGWRPPNIYDELREREKDPHRKWKGLITWTKIHGFLAYLQVCFLGLAFFLLLVALKVPRPKL